jgi:antirestriction protein ArdC
MAKKYGQRSSGASPIQEGAGKPSLPGKNNLYQEVTDRIVRELEQGRVPWVQPWGAAKAALGLPKNAATGRAYSGINILILWSAATEGGFPGQHWLTFRQALTLGGHVRKGERGTTVCYADRFTPKAEIERRARAASRMPCPSSSASPCSTPRNARVCPGI